MPGGSAEAGEKPSYTAVTVRAVVPALSHSMALPLVQPRVGAGEQVAPVGAKETSSLLTGPSPSC